MIVTEKDSGIITRSDNSSADVNGQMDRVVNYPGHSMGMRYHFLTQEGAEHPNSVNCPMCVDKAQN